MLAESIKSKVLKELEFSTSRSSGPGGQNVNKVESRVTLKFNLLNSMAMGEEIKMLLAGKLKTRLNEDGLLQMSSQIYRSQQKNKESVIIKFFNVLENALKPVKIRKKTKAPSSVNEMRLKDKNMRSEIKSGRGKITGY